MIRSIQVDNFKSLDGFSLPPVGTPPLANFTCLIGANGSGKTSVLQAFDFLAHLAKGRLPEWFRERGWASEELSSQFDAVPGKYIVIAVEIKMSSTMPIKWKLKFLPLLRDDFQINEESVWENNRCLLHAEGSKVSFMPRSGDRLKENSGLRFSGSALSILADEDVDPTLGLLKRSFSNYLANFELVSTFNLKQDSFPSLDIGPRGENLGGFIHQVSDGIRERIYSRMREFFPRARGFQRHVKDENGLVVFSLFEENLRLSAPGGSGYSNGVSSRHFSDGFTRILAVVAQIESSSSPGGVNAEDRVLLLDEIENGIHPELLGKFVRYLAEAPVQVIATTHSPMILNYLNDKQAEESVILLYRNSEGRTRSCRYFDLPSARKKLGILGPGEVYIDTSIEQMAREAEEMERGASEQTGATAQ